MGPESSQHAAIPKKVTGIHLLAVEPRDVTVALHRSKAKPLENVPQQVLETQHSAP